MKNWWVPRTVSGTSRYVFLGMGQFQGWNMKKSNFPHSILSLSAQPSIWMLRGLGFCAELYQELNWDPYEERKDTITRQEFEGGKPPMLRIWLQKPPSPEGGVAGTIICHPQWGSLICSHMCGHNLLWLCPCKSDWKEFMWLHQGEKLGEMLALLTFWLPVPISLALRKLSQANRSFFSKLLISSLSRNWPTFLNKGVLLDRPWTLCFIWISREMDPA